MEKIDISVIVPVYNVAQFIERNVRSLMNQSLAESVEFIFIDDCSPDDSIAIAKKVVSEYPERYNQVRFVRHSHNKGLPAARNTGLSIARGVYILHCDSDDFVEPQMLELLLHTARKNDADFIWCDWFLSFEHNERRMGQPKATTARNALTDLLNGSMKYNVWNKLVKKNLYSDNNISFPDQFPMGEDMTMIKLASKARVVASVNVPLYHYVRTNLGAMTQSTEGKKLKQIIANANSTIEYLSANVSDQKLRQELSWFKLNVKLPLLFTGQTSDFKRWREFYPESDSSIMSNKGQALRTRILQFAASKGLYWINKLYISLVLKVLYGKLYK